MTDAPGSDRVPLSIHSITADYIFFLLSPPSPAAAPPTRFFNFFVTSRPKDINRNFRTKQKFFGSQFCNALSPPPSHTHPRPPTPGTVGGRKGSNEHSRFYRLLCVLFSVIARGQPIFFFGRKAKRQPTHVPSAPKTKNEE